MEKCLCIKEKLINQFMRKVKEHDFSSDFLKKFLLVALILIIVIGTQAQSRSSNSSSYKTALGVKVWDGAGISLKHFFDKNAGELIAYFYGHGFRLTGLYEIHGPISGAQGLKWYIGPGAHIGFYDGHHGHDHDHFDDHSHTHIGIDGVIGLDYKFRGAPINVSIDWQPAFEFGDGGFYGNWGGLGIRYTF
jgi:hypothetical protein